MSRPAVLVTGAYGFVGAAYCAHLEANGVAWIGAVRARRRDDDREAIFEAGDFAGTDWDALFARHSIRHVVHLAARAHRMQETGGDPAAVANAVTRTPLGKAPLVRATR